MSSALSQKQQQQQQQLQQQQEVKPVEPPEPTFPEFANQFFINPKEIDIVWNSKDPKEDMINYTIRILKAKAGEINNQPYDLGDFEDRWDKEEQSLIAEYCLQNLCFFKHDAGVKDNYALVVLVNTYFEMLIIGENSMVKYSYYFSGPRNQKHQEKLRELFDKKLLTKAQVGKILEYAQQTVIKHLPLLSYVFSNKRAWEEKGIRVIQPKPQIASNLETNCTEIVEPQPEDQGLKSQQDFYQQEETQQDNEDDVESVVDPNDPLYGLDQRLKNMNLDDETRRIIKEKLEEAKSRVHNALDERQRNLDSKLAGDKNAPKKK